MLVRHDHSLGFSRRSGFPRAASGQNSKVASHAIRREIAKQTTIELDGHGSSPWDALSQAADRQHADSSGLRPWWIMPNASIKNILLSVPTSDEAARFDWLREQVTLYRLALGQPNQEDLLEILNRTCEVTPEQVRNSSLQLSSYFGKALAKAAAT